MATDSPRFRSATLVCLTITAILFFLQFIGASVSPGLWYGVYLLIAPWILKIAALMGCAFVLFDATISKRVRMLLIIVFASILLLNFPFGMSSILSTNWVVSKLLVACGNYPRLTVDAFLPCAFWVAASWIESFLRFAFFPLLASQMAVYLLAKKRGKIPLN